MRQIQPLLIILFSLSQEALKAFADAREAAARLNLARSVSQFLLFAGDIHVKQAHFPQVYVCGFYHVSNVTLLTKIVIKKKHQTHAS